MDSFLKEEKPKWVKKSLLDYHLLKASGWKIAELYRNDYSWNLNFSGMGSCLVFERDPLFIKAETDPKLLFIIAERKIQEHARDRRRFYNEIIQLLD